MNLSGSKRYFASTSWTLVWNAAAEQVDTTRGQNALEDLIRSYWQPLYSFARNNGFTREDAEDATQEFLSGIVQGVFLSSADPAKGKFRTFLLTAWKRFLIDEYRRQKTVKRGGHLNWVSLDFESGEQRWHGIKDSVTDPDQVFMLSWATTLLDEVRWRLQDSYAARGQLAVFLELMPLITQVLEKTDYDQLSHDLSLSTSAIKVALHRLRQRYGQTLREVVLETLDDPSEIETELAELHVVLMNH